MGRRIVQSVRKAGAVRTGNAREEYLNKVKNLIPADITAIYLAGVVFIPQEQTIGLWAWAGICLALCVFYIAKQTKKVEGQQDNTYPIDWTHVIISSISFVLWVYALGGPFASLNLQYPWIAGPLILAWTFVVPEIYKGKPA